MTADGRGWFWEMVEGRMPAATARIVLSDGQGPVPR
jgi:hypothetical protein